MSKMDLHHAKSLNSLLPKQPISQTYSLIKKQRQDLENNYQRPSLTGVYQNRIFNGHTSRPVRESD